MTSPLGSPIRLPSGARLPNRIVKAATSESLATTDGAPTDGLIEVYRQWAAGGAGTLITGNVMVDRNGLESPRNVVVTDERHLPALRRWAEAVHDGGDAALWMQINHAGRQAARRTTANPVAPSSVKLAGYGPLVARPRALESREVAEIADRFAVAAGVAAAAGFDGVQIHAAHGYLISQFLSPLSNQRDDEWGGDAARRMRFLLEVVGRVREAIGPDLALAVKLNSADFQRGGFAEGDALEVAAALEALGPGVVDVIEVSGGNYESPAMMGLAEDHRAASTRAREAYFLDFATAVTAAVEIPILLTGGLRSAASMNEVVGAGVALVGMARPLIAEPDLPQRLLGDASARAAVIDLSTGIRKLDGMIEALWYGRQLERLARGRKPRLRMSRFITLVRGFARNYAPTHFIRRRPRRAALPEVA